MVIHAKPGNQEEVLDRIESADERYLREILLSGKIVAKRMVLAQAFAIPSNCAESKDHEQAEVVLSRRCLARRRVIHAVEQVPNILA